MEPIIEKTDVPDVIGASNQHISNIYTTRLIDLQLIKNELSRLLIANIILMFVFIILTGITLGLLSNSGIIIISILCAIDVCIALVTIVNTIVQLTYILEHIRSRCNWLD